jgi:hypothetical protein
MGTLEVCLNSLVDLLNSDQEVTQTSVDGIMDPYLVGFGVATKQKRDEVAQAFHDRTKPSDRRDHLHARILKQVIA